MSLWHGLAAATLVVTALLGAVFAVAELGGRNVPLGVGFIHGLAAVAGLTLMGVGVAAGPRSLVFNAALLIAGMAALVGLLLFAFRLKREIPPAVIVLFHAAMGLVALGLALRALVAG